MSETAFTALVARKRELYWVEKMRFESQKVVGLVSLVA